MLTDNWEWLIKWFHEHCDGDWEHSFGVNIETLDNSGWDIQVSMAETELEEKTFRVYNVKRTESDWINCKVENGQFIGLCGTFNFDEVLSIFRNWVVEERIIQNPINRGADFHWLIHWFDRQCNGEWEHLAGIKIDTLDNPGWSFLITVEGTEVEEKLFYFDDIDRSDEDWVFCKVEGGIFHAYCGVFNFFEALRIFRKWVES